MEELRAMEKTTKKQSARSKRRSCRQATSTRRPADTGRPAHHRSASLKGRLTGATAAGRPTSTGRPTRSRTRTTEPLRKSGAPGPVPNRRKTDAFRTSEPPDDRRPLKIRRSPTRAESSKVRSALDDRSLTNHRTIGNHRTSGTTCAQPLGF